MLTYEKIVRKPKHFQSFTGITPQQFDFLSQKIQSEYQATEKKRLSSRKRERKVGTWHPFKLSVTTRILSDSQAKIRTLNINRESLPTSRPYKKIT